MGGCSNWGKGGILKVVPPLLVRGTLEAGGRRFAFASGISSDMAFIDQTCFWADFLKGLRRLGARGEFLRWFPPYSLRALCEAAPGQFAIAPGTRNWL